MRISLTSVDDSTECDYPGCPQLHFEGYVRGLQSRNADVKGFIQRFLDGTIRWKFVSGTMLLLLVVRMTYDGCSIGDDIRWYTTMEVSPYTTILFQALITNVIPFSGECIQIGNICSAVGLAGIWSGVQHSAGDPAGTPSVHPFHSPHAE